MGAGFLVYEGVFKSNVLHTSSFLTCRGVVGLFIRLGALIHCITDLYRFGVVEGCSVLRSGTHKI
jgi:hypothetical protein